MKTETAAGDKRRLGHKKLDSEDAAMMVMELENCISITLEGVEITRGTHKELGSVTLVTPVAGHSCLLYPFESHNVSCYKHK
jgi:hypothetical protein